MRILSAAPSRQNLGFFPSLWIRFHDLVGVLIASDCRSAVPTTSSVLVDDGLDNVVEALDVAQWWCQSRGHAASHGDGRAVVAGDRESAPRWLLLWRHGLVR